MTATALRPARAPAAADPGTRAGLRTETELLADLARCGREQHAGDAPEWARLEEQLRGIRVAELAPLEWEARLDAGADRLRALLLARGQRIDAAAMRSPDSQRERHLPGGSELRHGYERSLPASVLEARLADRVPLAGTGWRSESVAFGCGMAAIDTVLSTLAHMLAPTATRPLRIDFWGDYFETALLLEYRRGEAVRPRHLAPGNLAQAWSAPDAADILLIEPVRYNWDLDALDLPALVAGWRGSPHRPRIILLDTTLSAAAWPTRALLDALAGPHGAPLVIELRSGLKLDQQGLELANSGVADVFMHERPLPGLPPREALLTTLRLVRGTTGTGLRAADLATLDVPFAFEAAWTRRHCGQVFRNNAAVAAALAESTGGLFAGVAHPSLRSGGTVRHAPFVVARLREDTLGNHGLLLAALRAEVAAAGLLVTHGSSFGFRRPRFETIVPQVAAEQGLFKFAAGSRDGPALRALTAALCRLGELADIAALHRRYRGLEPVPLT